MIDTLARSGTPTWPPRPDDPGRPAMTVVFDAGQNSDANFAHLAATGLHYVGSVPPSDCPDLLALPARRRTGRRDRFPGLTAIDTRRERLRPNRRVVLTHSQNLHDRPGPRLHRHHPGQGRPETRRPGRHPGPRPHPPPPRPGHTEITTITQRPLGPPRHRLDLTGDTPADHRLTWRIDPAARTELENELFGKHVLITDHDDWPVADVVAGYRSQSEIEFGFRQLKDPHEVSFSPMYHWTDHNIPVHTFTCVLALQLAHLMRLQARPRRTAPVRPRPPGPAGRHPGNRADLPLHRRRPTQGPPHAHRDHPDPRPTRQDLPPRPVRTEALDRMELSGRWARRHPIG